MSLEDRIKLAEIKSRHQKALRPWYKRPVGRVFLLVLSLIALILIYSIFYVFDQVKNIKTDQINSAALNQANEIAATLYGSGNFYLGTSTPKLTIVEFSDFACPYCKQFSGVIRQAGEKYKDRVRIIFRDFPVVSENSIELAEAAHCAGAQGKFWEMHDLLFANQEKLKQDSDNLAINLRSLAVDLKLNADTFNLCLNDKAYLDVIKQNLEDGQTLGVTQTPTWFIGRNRGLGYLEEAKFNALIEKYLKE